MAPDELQFVTLCLGAEEPAVSIAPVREIPDDCACFRFPEGPDYLVGLIDVRGRQDLIRCLAKRSGDFIVVPDLERIFTIGCGAKTPSATAFTQH